MGAGRTKIDRNTKHVAEATAIIDKAQPHAAKALVEALRAMKVESRITGRDEGGNPTYTYVEVVDHAIRISAASKLLNKRLPDIARQEHTGECGGPVIVALDEWDKNA